MADWNTMTEQEKLKGWTSSGLSWEEYYKKVIADENARIAAQSQTDSLVALAQAVPKPTSYELYKERTAAATAANRERLAAEKIATEERKAAALKKILEEQSYIKAEKERIAAKTEQANIIAGIPTEAAATMEQLAAETVAGRQRVETLTEKYLEPVDVEARRAAETAKIHAEMEHAITETEKKVRSEAALRGGLYGGGYLGAMAEVDVTARLEEKRRGADFEAILAAEKQKREEFGIQTVMDLYKTHAQETIQRYQAAYNTALEKAKMAQQAGQFDVQLAWEQQALKIKSTHEVDMQGTQLSAQKEMQATAIAAEKAMNDANNELKLILADIEVKQRELDRLFTAGENEKARAMQLQIAKLQIDADKAKAKAANKTSLWGAALKLVGVGLAVAFPPAAPAIAAATLASSAATAPTAPAAPAAPGPVTTAVASRNSGQTY